MLTEIVKTPPASGAAPPRSGEEVELSLLDFDEARDHLAGYTREELIERLNPEPLKSQGFVEALTSRHPMDRAEAIYESRWKSFVDSLGLSDSGRNRLREILIAHDAHNIELTDLAMTGQISAGDHIAARRSLEQLAESLSSMLSGDQIALFWNEHGRRSNQLQQQMAGWEAQNLESGMVGILDAANRNDLATVQAYINSGADVDAITSDGVHTPLLDAASAGNAEMAQMLLAAGANPNMASADGYEVTPLQTAVEKGNIEIIRILATSEVSYRLAFST